MLKRPKRTGYKLYGRAITLEHPDGRIETHLLPKTAIYRDLSKATVSFEQWGPGWPSEHAEGDCTCDMWRAYVWRHFKTLRIFRGMKLLYRGFVRMIYG